MEGWVGGKAFLWGKFYVVENYVNIYSYIVPSKAANICLTLRGQRNLLLLIRIAKATLMIKKVCVFLNKSERILNILVFSASSTITKPHLYNFDPFKPHFYIVKLGFTGVYIIFFISAQKHRGEAVYNEYPQSMFWAEIWKISEFFIWKFSVFGGEIFYINFYIKF